PIGPPVTLALRCRPMPQLNLAQGQSAEVRLEAQLSDGTFADATLSAAWSSSAPAIATVAGGVVKAAAAGDALATGTYGGVSANCPVHVAAGPPSYGILPADPILLGLSGKVKLRFVQSLPGARPNTDVSGAVWSCKNASVATVSGGLVTGVSAGTATGEGGDGSSGAGGGGGGGGNGSSFCGGFNCGGGGASAGQAGQSAGLGTTSGGGNGATTSTGGAGAPGGGVLFLSPTPGDGG